MEERDEKLIAELIEGNQTLRNHLELHREYERQLEEFNRQIYLSAEESVERKNIQKLKLANRDQIELILARHRRNQDRSDVQGSQPSS